jgi:hypothetical protein
MAWFMGSDHLLRPRVDKDYSGSPLALLAYKTFKKFPSNSAQSDKES